MNDHSKSKMRELILAARTGQLDVIQELAGDDDDGIDELRVVIAEAAEHGQAECVKWLAERLNHKFMSISLKLAAKNGHLNCVKILYPYVNDTNDATVAALTEEQYDCARYIYPKTSDTVENIARHFGGDPKTVRLLNALSTMYEEDKDRLKTALHQHERETALEMIRSLTFSDDVYDFAIQISSQRGWSDCISELLSKTSLEDLTSSLQWAAKKGEIECMEILLPHSDPFFENSAALRWAAENGQRESVKFLIPHSDAAAAKAHLSKKTNGAAAIMLIDSVLQENFLSNKYRTATSERKHRFAP